MSSYNLTQRINEDQSSRVDLRTRIGCNNRRRESATCFSRLWSENRIWKEPSLNCNRCPELQCRTARRSNDRVSFGSRSGCTQCASEDLYASVCCSRKANPDHIHSIHPETRPLRYWRLWKKTLILGNRRMVPRG